jgi:hypothetical protein
LKKKERKCTPLKQYCAAQRQNTTSFRISELGVAVGLIPTQMGWPTA